MRHSPEFHRQVRRVRRRRPGVDFRITLAAVIALGGVLGVTFGGGWPTGVPQSSGPLFETVDRWAESRKSAELLKSQEGAPARISLAGERASQSSDGISARFGFCHTGGGVNCVVDGDTFWSNGERIRIADIDAPETHPSRCAEEARLGGAATQRLLALLNQGPATLEIADRDTDRYGRKLRIVTRGDHSLGDQLVAEGLARPWTGRRQPWC